MPILGLTEPDVEEVIAYLDKQSARIVDGGTAPQASRHQHH